MVLAGFNQLILGFGAICNATMIAKLYDLFQIGPVGRPCDKTQIS